MTEAMPAATVRTLVGAHEEFLRFLQARVGSREVAEDLLQSAFVKSFERGEQIREQDSAVAWFYRILRNALADHFRRHAVNDRAVRSISSSASGVTPEDPELERAICQCVKDLIPTLKEEYADILRQVEFEGTAVTDVAKAENISANNAMVRLHRARKALHGRLVQTCGTCTEHGCLECHCKRGTKDP